MSVVSMMPHELDIVAVIDQATCMFFDSALYDAIDRYEIQRMIL